MSLDHDYDYDSAELRVMQVRAETSGRIYLRSKSYGDYTGTGWLPAEELSSGSSLPFTAFAVSLSPTGVPLELEVRTLVDFDELCIPYYAAVSSGSDVFVASQQQINYKINYTDYSGDFKNLTLPSDAANSETVYQTHAHSVYTRLPEETRSAALAICQNAGLRADDPNIIPALASYVQNIGEYDLNVSSYPSDDYAIYFLTQSHTGYCIHFATAAVALYRTLGIPARVCEGYLVNNTAPGSSVKVTGADAHAWAEVYVDGLGWVPVEVTASAAEGEYQPSEGSVAPTPEAHPSEEPLEQTPPPEQGEAETPSETNPDESGSTPALPANRPGETGPGTTASARQPMSPALRAMLMGLVALAALAALIFGRYLILRKLLQARLCDPDGKKRCVNFYRQAERVLRYGGEMPSELQQCAEKARFSQHEISEEELQRCAAQLEELTRSVAEGLSRRKKLLFRYGSGNL